MAAVRSGKWKLHVDGDKPVALYNLESDISESTDVIQGNGKIVDQLLAHLETFQEDILKNYRSAAYVENPKPLTKN